MSDDFSPSSLICLQESKAVSFDTGHFLCSCVECVLQDVGFGMSQLKSHY